MEPKTTILCLLGVVGLISATPLSELRSTLDEYTTNLAESAYRLQDNVQPRYQYVDLDVYLEESRFNGFTQIEVEVLEDNLSQIVLHSNVEAISSVTLLDADNVAVSLLLFELDSHYEILKINTAQPISAGNYTIAISYLGRINENPLDRGFYKGYYFYNNETRYYATTQFQPYHARKAFPCFDEPQFKSQFVISITRDSYLSPSYSNMAINSTVQVSASRIRETFLPTPIVSAYLIAFHVSDFVETTENSTIAKPFGIISRPGVTDQHRYASDIGLRITNALDEYLDFNYYDMGQGQPMKNDHIALPDFPSGAMENWGMVNYREAYLLYDEQNTNMINKIFIATIMAHELGHKWFGNLVTCFWWSNLWLNESFASFFEYFGVHLADTSLELEDQFVVDYVHSALSADAGASIMPMNWSIVEDQSTITAHFSTSSYAKGASVLRMMEHFVGPITFRDALRSYLRTNAYGLGTPELMYAAFREAVSSSNTYNYAVDVGDVFDSWVQNAGSPVVNVDVNMDTGVIFISQERFQLSGTPEESLWHIPITWTHGGSPDFSRTTPTTVLSTHNSTLTMDPGHNWVILNIDQSGLYRVNYDAHNWQMLGSYLDNNRENIPKLNRAQIVNDLLFFIRAGKVDVTLAFEVLSFLKHETDYYVWAGALGQLDWIRRRLEHLPAAHQEFSNYLLETMDTVINHLGYEEQTEEDSVSTILNRMQIMNYACTLGHEGCISDSLEKWNRFKENESNLVPVNARRYVYCIGVRHGTAEDYEFLLRKYEESENTADMVVMLRALACTRDEDSLIDYLRQSMNNDKIRIHDRTNAYSYALQGNPENLQTVLNFTYNNFADIRETYGGEARLIICINALSTYLTDFVDIVTFQTFVYENQVALGAAFESGKSVVTATVNNLQWGNNVAVELYSFLLTRSSAVSIAVTPILLLLAMAAHYLH